MRTGRNTVEIQSTREFRPHFAARQAIDDSGEEDIRRNRVSLLAETAGLRGRKRHGDGTRDSFRMRICHFSAGAGLRHGTGKVVVKEGAYGRRTHRRAVAE